MPREGEIVFPKEEDTSIKEELLSNGNRDEREGRKWCNHVLIWKTKKK